MRRRKKHPFEEPIDFQKVAKQAYPWPAKKFDEDPRHLSDLHKHWPYTAETTYEGGLYGTVNLRGIPRHWSFMKFTKDQLLCSITQDLADAMYYPVVVHPEWAAFEDQAIEAFSMYQLIRRGQHYWQHPDKIPRPWEKTALEDARASMARMKKMNPGSLQAKEKPEDLAKHYMGYWPKNGRYMLKHRHASELSLQALQAIQVIVADSFENQC